MESLYETKLHQLAACLAEKDHISNIGLLSGTSGEVLFLQLYSQYYQNNRIKALVEAKIEKLFEYIEEAPDILMTHYGGLAGFAWEIRFLAKYKILNIDTDILLQTIDDV